MYAIYFVLQKAHVTHQEINLTNFLFNEMPALTSKIEECKSPMKSDDTTSSSV